MTSAAIVPPGPEAGRSSASEAAIGAEQGEVGSLTSLRMIAAGLVFVHHFPPFTGGLGGAISRQGHVGVTVFFVLSGFLITVRYFRAWSERRLRLRDYFVKRVARIFPLYYAVLALSLWMLGQPFGILGGRWPEWTMTQGLFWQSLYHAAVPTSWSLTVEECFYALAPVAFLALAAAGGLRRRRGWITVLGSGVLILFIAGLALVRFSGRSGLSREWYGFMADQRHMVIYTIFGRFLDFAVGIFAGLLYLRGDIARLWRRPGAAAMGTGLFILSAAVLVAALVAMDGEGGVLGPRYAAGWRYNALVALASALAIVALTCPVSLPARVLAAGPLVYLGKISYALYLVQMSPIGGRSLLGLTLAPRALHVVVLYGAMSVVSALLYELIEKPGRTLVFRAAAALGGAADKALASRSARRRRVPFWWTGRSRAPALAAAVAALALLFGATVLGTAVLLGRSGSPVTLTEVLAALPAGSPSLVTASLQSAERRGEDLHRVRLPEDWRTGRQRPLLLFVDGTAAPFSVGEPSPRPPGVHAFARGERTSSVLIRCPADAGCRDAIVARYDDSAQRAVGIPRLVRAPAALAGLTLLALLWCALLTAGVRSGTLSHPWIQAAVALLATLLVSLVDLGRTPVLAALVALGTAWLAAPLSRRPSPPEALPPGRRLQ